MTALVILTCLYGGYRVARVIARAGDHILRARRDTAGLARWERQRRVLSPTWPHPMRGGWR